MYVEKNLPFYGVYPQFTLMEFEDERMQEQDRRVMQSFYSQTAARIQRLAEEACDRMEYDGSMMFDEYPDKLMMEHLCRRIESEIQKEDAMTDSEEALMAAARRDHGMRDLIGVILFNEMFCRRCRKKNRGHSQGIRIFSADYKKI
ncbi:MAG: hypothetical protein PHG16_02880 [Lachnospiraceae bacterium]|nr:hypothetical protein [Lachnospiraceae bacterium]